MGWSIYNNPQQDYLTANLLLATSPGSLRSALIAKVEHSMLDVRSHARIRERLL